MTTVTSVSEAQQPLSLYRRLRRPLGALRRRIRRAWWSRLTGKQYRRWLAQAATTTPSSVGNPVALSVIVAVFDPPIDYLRSCIESVRAQTARNWQLVVSDDGSSDPAVLEYLQGVENEPDPRIIVVRGSNTGISAAQNRALEHVTHEFFGWIDHDDELDPRALVMMSDAIAANAQPVNVAYSDEDKIDDHGRHFDVYCKPDFSPELLMSQMYLCHFTVFRTSLVRDAGGFRSQMDGAQDFDLALRLLPMLSTDNVVHIRHPLYHWRAWAGSTASSIDAKPWAQEATARAQREHLERAFGGGRVMASRTPGLNDVRPKIPRNARISVIIPTAGTMNKFGERYVDKAVSSLRQSSSSCDLEIIAVTTNALANVPGVDKQIVYTTNDFNFAQAINLGRRHATSNLLLLLNDDTEVIGAESVERMLELIQDPGVAIVGAKLTYPNGRLQHVGMILLPSGPTHARIGKPGSDPGYFGSTLTPRNFSAVTAAAMLVKADVFDSIQGFDPAFARDFNDVDFCLRAGAAGYRVAWTPYAHFIHHEGVSIVRREPDSRERELFTRRWAHALKDDPFYSSALHPSIERLYEPL